MTRDINDFPKTYAVVNENCDPARVIKVLVRETEDLPIEDQYRGMRVIQILDDTPVTEGWIVSEMGLRDPNVG